MDGLNLFLAEHALLEEHVRFAASRRFVDHQGVPAEWEIQAISGADDEAIRKKFVYLAPIPGKVGQFQQEFDANGYLAALAAKCTVFPSLQDAGLQDSYGVMGAENLLKTMLLAGEYQEYLKKVQEVNGFLTIDDLAEQAKN